jgi:hypothetical protein
LWLRVVGVEVRAAVEQVDLELVLVFLLLLALLIRLQSVLVVSAV